MLSQSDVDIARVRERLNHLGLEVAFLVPTETGLEKSIMDATLPVQRYLASTGCHDYASQGQGQEYKSRVDAFLVHADRLEPTTASLYRPSTKQGDPRIWFDGLKNYVGARNLLAILALDDALYVLNCSDSKILSSGDVPGSPFSKIVARVRNAEDPAALELLGMLREVEKKGYVRTLRAGPTGVGMTLETLLGIEANTNAAPDYKGIEIKASRTRPRGATNRVTLFSQVPNWNLSPVGSAWNLLSKFGYVRDGRLQLYHQLDAVRPNSIGLLLEVEEDAGLLKQVRIADGSRYHATTWELEKLRSRLVMKHPATFWVKADARGQGDAEEFYFSEVHYTRFPFAWNLESLIEAGTITLDYTLSDKNGRARDHGYLFKIHPADLGSLFPPARVYKLAE